MQAMCELKRFVLFFFFSLPLKLEACSVGNRAKLKQQLIAGIASC